ncbi:MAG: hypothetical protein PVF77_03695 [Anaerolineae bacterium]
MQVFIAGVMQGSRRDHYIGTQDYRSIITQVIKEHHPGIEIVDPNELHPNGVDYDDNQAKATLLEMADLAGRADLVVAYAPEASMGTALEMWQAYQGGVPLITISPMAANWVIKHLSTLVLPDLDAFRAWVANGGFDKVANLD